MFTAPAPCPPLPPQEELRAAGQQQQRPPAVLKFRPAGSKEWVHPCLLLPGLHAAAAGSSSGGREGSELGAVHISRCCATIRLLLLPHNGPVLAAGEAQRAEVALAATEEQRPLPLWVDLRCRELQLCVWDDERQRLLPPAGDDDSDGMLGRELFSLSLDHLHLQLSREVRLDTAAAAAAAAARHSGRPLHPWQQQVLVALAARASAAAVQIDSFLPGSEQPVLLTSLPEGSLDAGGSSGGNPQRSGPPLQLALEVHHCPPSDGAAADAQGGSSSMSFRNAWVHDLRILLPTVAVAADDALLLFLERLSALLAGSGGSFAGLDGGSGGGGSGSSSGSSLAPPAPAAAATEGAVLALPPSALAALQHSLALEAAGAAASRLYIAQAAVESGECGRGAVPWCHSCRMPASSLTPLPPPHPIMRPTLQ